MLSKFIKKEYIVYVKYTLVVIAIVTCGIIYTADSNAELPGQGASGNNAISMEIQNGEASDSPDENIKTDSLNDSELNQNTKDSVSESEEKNILIHVCGAVVSPGVYMCPADSRLYEVIDMAGGFCEDANDTYLNLVDKVADGQKVYVPYNSQTGDSENGMQEVIQDATGAINNNSGLVNINTATKEQLMTLPGIGESKAADIINYRKNNGGFSKPEDIKNISGIKEAAYSKIKDMICT